LYLHFQDRKALEGGGRTFLQNTMKLLPFIYFATLTLYVEGIQFFNEENLNGILKYARKTGRMLFHIYRGSKLITR
jgi:hypothetical protein